ncbi:MAG: DUF6348 family protein [Pirellulales bacterium]
MTEDLYRMALDTLRRHLDAAEVHYALDDGDLGFGGHRLSLSVSFDNFVEQSGQVIAPVDVQLHVDADDGSRFRLGTLGIGGNQKEALRAAVEEWHTLAAAPVLAALGAPLGELRREAQPPVLAGWKFFPGRAGIRGSIPMGLEAGGAFHRALLGELHKFVSSWEVPSHFSLRSIFVYFSSAEGKREAEAAVDGIVHDELTERIKALDWPQSDEPYLYKQLFVFRLGE